MAEAKPRTPLAAPLAARATSKWLCFSDILGTDKQIFG
jgi:hypothetical protein